jgi:hypothetical protein
MEVEATQDIKLIKAVARAFRCRQMLETGRFGALAELAAVEKINASYASCVFLLTLLAPDIVEAILAGRHSEGISQPQPQPQLVEEVVVEWGRQRNTRRPRQKRVKSRD